MYEYYTKKFPPYGKIINEMRKNGRVPAKRVIVTTDWKLGAVFPRIIIPKDQPVTNLHFQYLAGLHTQIVYHDDDASIMPDLTAEILAVKPASLAVFNMDAVARREPAFSMIHGGACNV